MKYKFIEVYNGKINKESTNPQTENTFIEICYSGRKKDIYVYTDRDWGSDRVTRCSTSGYIVLYSNYDWRSS